jgi:hypothetical protein
LKEDRSDFIYIINFLKNFINGLLAFIFLIIIYINMFKGILLMDHIDIIDMGCFEWKERDLNYGNEWWLDWFIGDGFIRCSIFGYLWVITSFWVWVNKSIDSGLKNRCNFFDEMVFEDPRARFKLI